MFICRYTNFRIFSIICCIYILWKIYSSCYLFADTSFKYTVTVVYTLKKIHWAIFLQIYNIFGNLLYIILWKRYRSCYLSTDTYKFSNIFSKLWKRYSCLSADTNWRTQNQSGLTHKCWLRVSPPNLENMIKISWATENSRFWKFEWFGRVGCLHTIKKFNDKKMRALDRQVCASQYKFNVLVMSDSHKPAIPAEQLHVLQVTSWDCLHPPM